MFNKFANIVVISTFALMIILPLTWFGAKFYWQNKTKELYNKAKSEYIIKYSYVVLRSNLDQVLYGENFQQGKELANYYKKEFEFEKKLTAGKVERKESVIDGDTSYYNGITIPNSVDLNYIPVKKPIYIRKEKDSVVEAFVFNTRCWGYYKAYLPEKVLHDSPPPDSLYENFKDHVESLPESDPTRSGWSRYGFYCN